MTLQEALEKVQQYAKNNSPAVIYLSGNLGAGKTHFTNQFASAIGVTQKLPSPTFTFLQEYKCDFNGKKKIIHADFYRITPEQSEKILEQLGFWDYLDQNNIIFIEWPERAVDQLQDIPHMTLTINLSPEGERIYETS